MKPGPAIGLCILIYACGSPGDASQGSPQAVVRNDADIRIDDALVVLGDADPAAQISNGKHMPIQTTGTGDTTWLPAQWNDLDGDGTYDQLVFLVSLDAGAETQVTFDTGQANAGQYEKRTHAEISVKEGGEWNGRVYEGGDFVNVDHLKVPPEHTDHSFYIRYEGPGWESEKVGYRFYLDWRNATDIFGKTQPGLVLRNVGLDGFDSYHEMAGWGMDILKVGESLGIGSLGRWSQGQALRVAETDSVHCDIVLDGPVQSMVRTTYYGWQTPGTKTDVTSELSIVAASRMTRHDVQLTSPIDSLCTGIVKHEDARVLIDTSSGEWGYLATWGRQSLADDMLGMAVFFRNDALLLQSEDEHSQVVVLQPSGGRNLTYYFAACWEQETGGIRSQEAFQDYLGESLTRLSHPVQIEMTEPQ